jgi:hypothetical protein
MTEIYVIDELPGTGKTSWVINRLKESGERFVYVTPLKPEQDRICKAIPNTIKPMPMLSETKYTLREGFRQSICHHNIATTHALFLQLDSAEIPDNTTLVIDEALDVIDTYDISRGRLKNMLSSGDLVVSTDNRLLFMGNIDDYDEEQDQVEHIIYRACKSGLAYLFEQNVVIAELSPAILKQFSKVYILTYKFINSLFYSWLTSHCLLVKMIKPELMKSSSQVKAEIRELIHMPDVSGITALGYSYTWNDWKKKIKKPELKKKISTYLGHNTHIKIEDMLFTCPKDQWDKLRGTRYKTATWLAVNTRATNEYKDKTVIFYLWSRNYKPEIKRFCEQHKIPLDNDQYALTELIQFIFRSALRDNKPITLILPSARMRKLFVKWLGEST